MLVIEVLRVVQKPGRLLDSVGLVARDVMKGLKLEA